jgi:murein DD-endopeptidase MepM/ murein hydrolase activator NlpD
MKRAALLVALALLAAAAPVPPEQESEHIVQPGETLGGIAVRAQVPRVLIAEANGLKPPYSVRAGQKLIIPRTRRHTVVRGETSFTIAYAYGVRWRDIAVANGLDPEAAIRPGLQLLIPTIIAPPATEPALATAATVSSPAPRFAWPVAGKVRRGFAPRGKADYHDGLDIRAAQGTAARAAAAGKVLFAGAEPRQFGNLVVLSHPGGWQSAYAFLSRITVKEGDDVGAGERVGLVGSTGLARGSELHFELRKDNRPVDPGAQLPERK